MYVYVYTVSYKTFRDEIVKLQYCSVRVHCTTLYLPSYFRTTLYFRTFVVVQSYSYLYTYCSKLDEYTSSTRTCTCTVQLRVQYVYVYSTINVIARSINVDNRCTACYSR